MDPQQVSLDAAPLASSTFTASWTPSKAAAFNANNVPLNKLHRAWERKPLQSKSDNGKTKTVWKRYQLRSQPGVVPDEERDEQHSDESAAKSPGRIVKKARVVSPVKGRHSDGAGAQGRRKSSATKCERRKSGYRRKAASASAVDAPMTPTFDASTEMEAISEPTKGLATKQHDPIDVVEETAQKEDTLVCKDAEEQEDSMCDAAETQLLTEAGLEPIPADFAISPVKKLPRLVQRPEPVELEKARELAPEERDDSVMETDEVQSSTGMVHCPSSSESTASQQSVREGSVSDEVPTLHDNKPLPIANTPSRGVSYPSIDIFGLDDEDVEAPAVPQPQSIEEQEDGEDDEQSKASKTFTISLNDETVNLGALLAKKGNLSAIITDDEIQLEVGDAEDEADESSPQKTDATLEPKEDDSPADSPDELSMDLDVTETVTTIGSEAFTHLEDDKAKLSSFLRRVAAAKEKKSASVSRRESLQNRRDSDVVRKALASSRQVLEEKDKNLSPQRQYQQHSESTLNLGEVLTNSLVKPVTERPMADADEQDELSSEYQTGSPRRRSSRTRSKLPQFSSQSAGVTPNKISVRTDGGEKVNLNRTEAQQLADLVRRNTKKNKGSSIPAPQRLAKLKLDSLATIVDGESPVVERLLKQGVKSVTWREQLADYATSIATANLEAEATAATAEESTIKGEPKKMSGSGKPRLRKLKALGGSNGTPSKKVLQSIPLPDGIEEEKPAKSIWATSANAKKKHKIAALAMVPSAGEPASLSSSAAAAEAAAEDDKKSIAAQKKNKLQQPKKLNLNPSLTSIGSLPMLQGKENSLFSGLNSPAKKMSKIPAPSGIPAPATVSMDITCGLRPPVKRVRTGVGKKA